MKVLLVSDVPSPYIWDYFDRAVFEGVACVLSCGDLPASYLEFMVTMLGVPLYYVPGNHDKSYLREPPQGCENMDGRLEDICGFRVLGLGGCRAPNRDTYQYTEWDMERRIKRLRPQINKGGFDILLSHAPAFGLGDGTDLFHHGFECFRELLERHTPKYHFFGHQHKNYSYGSPPESYGPTRLINASGYKVIELS